MAAVVALVTLGATAACSSTSTAAATQATCRQVGAVLSDGPDPGADPVGYAEAQVRPLAAVHPTDTSLARTVTRLDHAFAAFEDSDGAPGAGRALARAERQMNAACPGVAP